VEVGEGVGGLAEGLEQVALDEAGLEECIRIRVLGGGGGKGGEAIEATVPFMRCLRANKSVSCSAESAATSPPTAGSTTAATALRATAGGRASATSTRATVAGSARKLFLSPTANRSLNILPAASASASARRRSDATTARREKRRP
jgi:hypothetical protein